MQRQPLLLSVALVVAAGSCVAAQRLPRRQPKDDLRTAAVRELEGLRPNENLLFNGWGLTPAGRHIPVSDMPLKMVLSPDGKYMAAIHGGFTGTGITLVHLVDQRVTQFQPLARAFNGVAFSADGKRLFAAGGNSGLIHTFSHQEGRLIEQAQTNPAPDAGDTLLAGLAVHPTSGKLYVCNEAGHEVWVVDPNTLRREATISVGSHPHAAAFGQDRRHLYISNWGSRSVSVIDTRSGKKVRDLPVGIRPNDLTLGKDGRLFVACAGDNTVHVIQTRGPEASPAPASSAGVPEGVREILSTSLYPASPEGSTPSAVAVSGDGRTLYVANADNNNVLAADLSDPNRTEVKGFVPTGWYPTSLAVSPGGMLIVGNGKGLASRENVPVRTQRPLRLHKQPAFDEIGASLQGYFSFIAPPEGRVLADYTEQVRRNTPYTPETLTRSPIQHEGVIPDTVPPAPNGEFPIKHVLYIVKENRSYDQVFGDFRDARRKRVGNGAPELAMFGEDVAPNHHQLARDYVLLDNLYSNGDVSADGHSWATAAMATDFTQRRWVTSYSGRGLLFGSPELQSPAAGYLWDLCKRHGIPYKCYGEGADRVPSTQRGTWPEGRDMDRVQGWLRDLEAAEKTGDLPRFTIMALGEDHTFGSTPGRSTPEACVASNDIALGRIVAAASRSRFWKEMAIFVIEDDAQNGPDHVDAHRTLGFVISPWAKRGAVDSTHYTTASMLRTMELILGLPPLTQFDAAATPMFNSFRKEAKLTQYVPLVPKVDLHAVNPPATPSAAR